MQRNPDITQARDCLSWEPKVPLDEGLPRTIDYFRKVVEAGWMPARRPA
jgi:nucleoside-diphosphate-sugar epimerase